jgi:RsiW-degrading membrane proteinase PrsW (M82 family)
MRRNRTRRIDQERLENQGQPLYSQSMPSKLIFFILLSLSFLLLHLFYHSVTHKQGVKVVVLTGLVGSLDRISQR